MDFRCRVWYQWTWRVSSNLISWSLLPELEAAEGPSHSRYEEELKLLPLLPMWVLHHPYCYHSQYHHGSQLYCSHLTVNLCPSPSTGPQVTSSLYGLIPHNLKVCTCSLSEPSSFFSGVSVRSLTINIVSPFRVHCAKGHINKEHIPPMPYSCIQTIIK